jgi:4'-phosphopantetheinyl transferase
MKECRFAGFSFELSPRYVDVWAIRTEVSTAVAERLERILAPDERNRAARFHFDHLRLAFIAARGALRLLLGCYLKLPPASIQIAYGSNGKPGLTESERVKFNVSHSGALAVFAFAVGCDIGVDVEQIHPLANLRHIAERTFCPEEAAEIMLLPEHQRDRAFFVCWTRKEAYVKAIGTGLSSPFDSFRVTLRPDDPTGFVHLQHDANATKEWTLHDLDFGSDYAAALAYRDTRHLLRILPHY